MPDLPNHENAPREITRWRGRPFLLGLLAFFALMAVTFAIGGRLTHSWTHRQWPAHDANLGATADSAWNNEPPQLQTHASTDLKNLQAAEYKRLHVARWVDPSHTYAAIPIEDAMNLLVQAQKTGQLNQLLPAPKPATPIDLQVQKSTEAAPLAQPMPSP